MTFFETNWHLQFLKFENHDLQFCKCNLNLHRVDFENNISLIWVFCQALVKNITKSRIVRYPFNHLRCLSLGVWTDAFLYRFPQIIIYITWNPGNQVICRNGGFFWVSIENFGQKNFSWFLYNNVCLKKLFLGQLQILLYVLSSIYFELCKKITMSLLLLLSIYHSVILIKIMISR